MVKTTNLGKVGDFMQITENKEVMSRNIRKFLGYNKMTASELARKLDVSRATVSSWVNGTYYPRISYIEEMSKIFKCNKSDLIEDKSAYTEKYDMPSNTVDFMVMPTNNLSIEETILIEIYRNESAQTREQIKRILKYDETLQNLIGGIDNEFIQNLKKQIQSKRNG